MFILFIVILIIAAGVWIASHISFFKGNQIRQGVLLGVLAIIANSLSADFGNLKISVGLIDIPPMLGGFFFGPVAGIIASCMAAIERAMTPLWGVGVASWGRCSIATFGVGIYAIVLHRLTMSEQKPTAVTCAVAMAFGEMLHLAFLFVVGWNTPSFTCEMIYAAVLPMTLGAGVSAVLATVICAWRGWQHSFYSRTTLTFLLFGVMFGIIVGAALYSANRTTSALLTQAMQRYNTQINDHLSFALHRSAHTIMESIGTVHAVPIETMQKYATEHKLDEISVVNKAGEIIASNRIENLEFRYFLRSDKILGQYFALVDGRKKVVKQPFRESLSLQKHVECFIGIPFPARDGFLQIGYMETRFLEEFEYFYLPQMKNATLAFNGYYLVVDDQNRICGQVHQHPEAHYQSLRSIGFTENELKYPEGVIFNARLFGDWSRCLLGRQIGKWRIYAVLPLYDVYVPMLKIVFLSGFSLILLSFLFRWTIVKMTEAQQKVEELNQQKETRNKKDMQLAFHVQNSELKEDTPDNTYYRIESAIQPAREVGGDFYDYYVLPSGKVVFGVADVSGKGIPAAIFMMKAKILIKLYAFRSNTIQETMEHANFELCRKNTAQMFVTSWAGMLDPKTGDVEFVSAGHNPPLILRKDGTVEWVECNKNLPLAVRAQYSYHPQKIHLNHGDRLFLYTDGVTEAMNIEQKLYGNQRLFDILSRVANRPVIDAVFTDLRQFARGAEQSDDITMLTMLFK